MASRITPHTNANGVDSAASHESELGRVLDAYLAAIEAGQAIDPPALAAAHPAIAEWLPACLSVLRVAGRFEGRADAALESPEATCLGDFRMLRVIGRGGMGIVFEAEQVSLKRKVALKVLPFAAALDPQQLRRFQIEAQAAAQLHHTNIVPIFSVGCERGVHFYAMQYIEGQTLADLIHDVRQMAGLGAGPPSEPTATSVSLAGELVSGRLAPVFPPRPDGEGVAEEADLPKSKTCRGGEERVRGLGFPGSAYFRTAAHLALQAAEALDHAHRLGIIHRDIKPANLLIDVRGNLWITDFGLARMHADGSLTLTGDIIGTLRYTSPEQATPQRAAVDHRTDVYSLGATLYELLTLHPVHEGVDRAELIHQMAFAEPKPPRTWNPAIPRDLETIVLKALAKDVQGRYASSLDLADDLRRFLEDRPIHARRPSLWNRAVKWGRRHKALASSAIIVLMLAVAAAAITTTQTRKNQALLRDSQRRERLASYTQDIRQAFHLVRQNDLPGAIRALSRHGPAPTDEDNRSFPWYYLWRLCHFKPRTLTGHEGDVYHVEYSPWGKTLASCGRDGAVRLWDADSGQLIRILRGHDGDVNYVTFSPDGRMLATGGDDGTVRLWDAATGKALSTLGKHSDWVTCVLFTPDGKQVVTGGRGGILKLWDIRTGAERRFPATPWNIEGMAISPDGRTLVTGGGDNSALLWDLSTAKVKLRFPAGSRIQSVAFSRDGLLVATAGLDRIIRTWYAQSGQLKDTFAGHRDQIQCVAFSPDDSDLATGADDGTVRVWDRVTTGLRHVFRRRDLAEGHDGRLWCVAFSPDRRTLASYGRDAKIHLWDLSTSQDSTSIRIPSSNLRSMVFSRDSRRATAFALAGTGGMILDLDPARGEVLVRRRIHSGSPVFDGVISRDGKTVATAARDGIVALWDAEADRPPRTISVPGLRPLDTAGAVRGLPDIAFSPDGRFLAITTPLDGILLWDTDTGTRRQFPSFDHAIVRFLPKGDGMLVVSDAGLTLVDMATAKYRASRSTGASRAVCLAPSADGRIVAIGSNNGRIELADAMTLKPEAILLGHSEPIVGLAWSPDGRVLASASRDRTVTLWNVSTRGELGVLKDFGRDGMGLMFSPDGSILAGFVQRWSAEVVFWHAPRDENSRDSP